MSGSMCGAAGGRADRPVDRPSGRAAIGTAIRRHPTALPGHGRAGGPVGPDLVDRALAGPLVLMAWTERRRQRRRLRELAADPAFLHDVGISRADALAEAARPFWRR